MAPGVGTRVHMVAMTDFNQCTSCTSSQGGTNNVYGAYVGLSSVRINTECATGCSCTNWPPA